MTRRVCQVSLSDIDRDARVLRTIHALRSEGYEVQPLGYGYGLPDPKKMSSFDKVKIALRQLPAWFLPRPWSQAMYWATREARQLYQALLQHNPDIIHAHDWNTLPAAARAAEHLGVPLIYESHEFAIGQRLHRIFWRVVFPAYIKQLESHYIKTADHVVTVSDGVAEALQSLYSLKTCPTVVRSTPEYVAVDFRVPDVSRICVHYHGIFTQGRGLEQLIKSVVQWPKKFRLRLTGWGQPPSFEAHLKKLVDDYDLSNRVRFNPRVPHERLIEHAAEADIGICFWDGSTPQLKYALPNKAFEYTMAGLMLISGPSVELERLIKTQKIGLSLKENSPDLLAETLQQISPEEIAAYKRNALQVAIELSWKNEQRKLIQLYDGFDST